MAEAKDTSNEATKPVAIDPAPRTVWRSPFVITGLVLGVAVLIGAVAWHHGRSAQPWAVKKFGMHHDLAGRFEGGPHPMAGGVWKSGRLAGNEARLHGVATKVDGDTVTVAGDGKTNTVKVSSSTQYSGGNSVAVNDTVVVGGTINNGTFTATQVLVNP